MRVKKEQYVGYARYVLMIGEEEAAELFVFTIDHPNRHKLSPYLIFEDFSFLRDDSYEARMKYGTLIIKEIAKEEMSKSEKERITWVKLGTSFQKVGKPKEFLNRDVSAKGSIDLSENIYYDGLS